MIGREIGADNHEKAKDYAGKFSLVSFAVGICVAIFMIITAKPCVNTFFKNIEPKSAALAVYAIIIDGLYMPFRYVLSLFLRG